MKDLSHLINEALTKNIKEGSPLIDVLMGNIYFSQRGAKKFLNNDVIEEDFTNIGKDVKKLDLYTFDRAKVDDVAAKACLLILNEAAYSKDYKQMEANVLKAAQKYSNVDLKSVEIMDCENNWRDLTGHLYIVVRFNSAARLTIHCFLDGYVEGKYKTTPVSGGVDIDYDEFEEINDKAAFTLYNGVSKIKL